MNVRPIAERETMHIDVDIKETELHRIYPEAFNTLLRDHSRFHNFKESKKNYMTDEEMETHKDDPCNLIIWATDDYASLGEDYTFHEPITVEKIIGEHGMIIRPRCKKSLEEQSQRIKDKAEVFTPSWVCNLQNNLVDEAWFGRKGVFNEEVANEDGTHHWVTTKQTVEFPEGKTWKDYVCDRRMEITCGEAPYLCSRYDTTTGEAIALEDRIGLLDRKLRVVSENCDKTGDWLKFAQQAYMNTYGYEWQGDNLLLARESLLCTFLEYYQAKFNKLPLEKSVNYIAYIISWNLWQMDGLKMVVPGSCDNKYEMSLFNGLEKIECPACAKGEITGHQGVTCYVRHWRPNGNHDIPFSTLINQHH